MHLMIVDDERLTRETLATLIDWPSLGISNVELASDGMEALEKTENIRPDILITDVRMPIKDGMKLAEEITCLFPECKILFLSGYSDKEYLFNAIKLRANAYIEKPIDPDQVANAVGIAIEEIKQDRENKTLDIERQDMLRQDFVRKLLSGDICLSKQIALKAGINYENKKWYAETAYIAGGGNPSALLEALNECKTLSDVYVCRAGRFIHILTTNMINGLQKILPKAAGKTDIQLYVGTASGKGGIEIGNRALNESVEAAKNAHYFEKTSVDFESILDNESLKHFAIEIPDSLFSAPDDTKLMITAIFKRIKDCEGMSRPFARDTIYKICSNIVAEAKLYNVPFSPLSSEPETLWQWINQWETLSEVQEALADAFSLIFSKTDKSTHVRRAIEFIEQRIGDCNLSISMVAVHLGLNQSYFCTLFRKEMKKTVGQYITGRRMQKAKAHLAESNAHIKDVAGFVGYVDVAWFIKRFKQTYKMTPSEFKERHG